jgi:hypothetical protein
MDELLQVFSDFTPHPPRIYIVDGSNITQDSYEVNPHLYIFSRI